MPFNFKQYFDQIGVNYRTSGKNIGNFIGIKDCPWCSDSSYHLGISKDGTHMSCWKCGRHQVVEFIKIVEQTTWQKAKERFKQFQTDEVIEIEDSGERIRPTSYQLPQTFTEIFPQIAKDYIAKRRYDFLDLRKKYGILWGGEIGRAKNRICFPVKENNRIVNWVGRSIYNGKDIQPYMFERNESALVQRGELLFGLDDVKGDKAILVEGVFNVTRLGPGTVAMLSTNFSRAQVLKLKQKGIGKFWLCFDGEEAAQKRAQELEACLTWAEVRYIELPKYAEDPDMLNDDDVRFIRREIF